MTRLNAVASTAAAPNQPTTFARELLWEGGVVEIDVPLEARQGEFADEEVVIHFLQWRKLVVGGMVNLYLHVPLKDINLYRGDTLKAEVKVWRKEVINNRSFIYVDLLPTSANPTHTLYVLNNLGPKQKALVPYPEGNWEIIETPLPLQGAVVLVPLTAMRLDVPLPGQTKSEEPAAPTTPTTGYPGLDRKLADGWLVASEDDRVVQLYKTDGSGNKRTDKFFKPQLKTKKKR